jgi:hypothetical protein
MAGKENPKIGLGELAAQAKRMRIADLLLYSVDFSL